MRKNVFAAAVCAVAIAAVGAGPALAGEITGNGKPLWTNTTDWNAPHTLNGNSICAFSGQEDLQFPANPEFDPNAGHSQSWGQLVKVNAVEPSQLKGGDPSPGTSCNGHTGYLSGP